MGHLQASNSSPPHLSTVEAELGPAREAALGRDHQTLTPAQRRQRASCRQSRSSGGSGRCAEPVKDHHVTCQPCSCSLPPSFGTPQPPQATTAHLSPGRWSSSNLPMLGRSLAARGLDAAIQKPCTLSGCKSKVRGKYCSCLPHSLPEPHTSREPSSAVPASLKGALKHPLRRIFW